jgi:cation:H+ antiporter
VEILEFAVALVVILVAAELFTNGIEWFGHKLNLAEGAVGSVLAAVGTALPETMIPLVAIFASAGSGTHDPTAQQHIGVGAILGAPFMLATLAMFVTGLGVVIWAKRRPRGREMPVNTHVLGMDMRYFFIAYGIAVAAAFVPADLSILRYAAVVALIAIYAWYVKSHFEADPNVDAADLAPLRFRRVDVRHHRRDPQTPRLRVVSLQVLVALALIIVGAFVFVDAVEHISTSFGLDPALLALVVAPIATELPEKFNSLIWVRGGKDTLALGNITGAMVFQSCIPTSIGIVLAAGAWTVTADSLVSFASAGIAFAASAVIFWPMIRRGTLSGNHLLIGGLFYVIYLIVVVAALAGLL